jgi:hypothetical protein
MFTKEKVIEWIKRYLPAEILSTVITLLSTTYDLTHNAITTAIVGTWTGNISYFGYILLSDITISIKVCKSNHAKYGMLNLFHNVKVIVLEFGLAELFDSILIRPALMYYLPIWVGNLSLGVLLAKLVADVIFYIPAIIAYELRLKHLKQ